MSKINRIRIINLVYNHGSRVIGDITMNSNGNDTLIELVNGGGKSVLIQAVTAPLAQKKRFRDTKYRKFEELFDKSMKSPTFIMIEWELDDHAGYMLNGLMVKRNADTSNNNPLLMTGFIGEYKYPCDFDIASIPVIETINGKGVIKGYDSCKKVFESFKKLYPGLFTYYDMNSEQGRNYFKRLATYGVNHLEWENIIHRINEDESGVADLFDDCPTVRKMTEKWFLKLIEEKLNTDMDKMDNFRTVLESFILECIKNQDSFKKKEQFSLFEKKSESIRQSATERDRTAKELENKKYEIAAYNESLTNMSASIQQSIAEKNEQQREYEEEIKTNTYQKYSAEYYEHENRLNEAERDLQHLEERLAGAERQKEKWTHEKHLLEASEQHSRLDERNAEYGQAYQKLEVSQKKDEELQPEREKLGYLIKQAYVSKENACIDDIRKTEDEIAVKKTAKATDTKQVEETQKAIRNNATEIGSLKTKMDTFESEKKVFESKWNTELNSSDSIRKETEKNNKQIGDHEKAREQANANLIDTEKKLSVLSSELTALDLKEAGISNTLSTAKEKKEKYDREIGYRKDVLRYLDLPESVLFDTDKIMAASDSKIESLNEQIIRHASDLESVSKEYKKLETGAIEIDDELKNVMESLGIDILYGIDWLRNNGNSEEENRKLIRQNPYIPYALIMTRKDFDELQAVRSVYTSSPVPIVIRENLYEMPTVSGIDFYMMFNENLLNPEKLEELKAELERKISRTKELKAINEDERNGYTERKANVKAQEVTETLYLDISGLIEHAEKKQKEIQEKRIETKTEKAENEEKKKELENKLKELESAISILNEQRKELDHLSLSYAQYLKNREKLEAEERKERELKENIGVLEKQIRFTDEEIHQLESKKRDLEYELKNLESQASEFQIYTKPVPTESRMTFESMVSRYQAISNTSKDMAELKENLQKADEKRKQEEKRLKNLVARYGLHDGEWLNVRYSEDQMTRVETLIKEFNDEWNEIKDEISECKSRISKIESAIDYVEKEIAKIGYDEPMPEEELVIIDFEMRNKEIEMEMQDTWKQVHELERRLGFIENSLTALSEYSDFKMNPDITCSCDDFKNEQFRTYTGQLQKEYKRLCTLLDERTSSLKSIIEEMIRIPEFADNHFKRPLERMKDHPDDAMKCLEATLERHSQIMRAVETNVQSIEKERENMLETMMTYLYDVHKEMGLIDKCSTIPVHDKTLKMFRIEMPKWDDYENIYRQRLKDRIMTLTDDCMNKEMNETEIHARLGKEVTLNQLYDATVGIDNLQVKVYKIEEKTERLITWEEAIKISGGESVLTSFIVLSCLLYYMRRDNSNFSRNRIESKVVIMDNPYAKCSARHLLDPLMEMAKKTNTQIISLTGHESEDIMHNFDNICILRNEQVSINDKIYMTCENVNMDKLNYMQIAVNPA